MKVVDKLPFTSFPLFCKVDSILLWFLYAGYSVVIFN